MKAMTKNQLKAHNKKLQTIKELTLLIPAFSFLWESIEKASDEDKNTVDYKITKHICNQLAFRIKPYRQIQQQIIDNWRNIRDEVVEAEHSVFLAGLALLGTHMEIKNKYVNVGLNNEIMELQELAYGFFEAQQINETAEWSEQIKKVLKA